MRFSLERKAYKSSQTMVLCLGLMLGFIAPRSVSAQQVRLVSVTLNSYNIKEGQTALGTVTLSGPAPRNGVIVNLFTPARAVNMPRTLRVPENQSQATFSVETPQCNAPNTIAIDAIYNGVQRGIVLRTTPVNFVNVTFLPSTVRGGQTSQMRITMDAILPSSFMPVRFMLLASNYRPIRLNFDVMIPRGVQSFVINIPTQSVPSSMSSTIRAVTYWSSSASGTLIVNP